MVRYTYPSETFSTGCKVFATQLLHRNRKMKDLFPTSSFTKTIGNHSLVERLDPLPMVVLLKIEGNCSCLRAKVAHMVGHLPPQSAHSLGYKMNCFPLCERKTSRSQENERTVRFHSRSFHVFCNTL